MQPSLYTSTAGKSFAEVILPLNLPQTLTYGVPIEWQDVLEPGMRVEVSLGKNKKYAGIVAAIHGNQPGTYQVKPIKSIIDEAPVVNAIQLKFWTWIGKYYMAAPGEVMNASLPAHLKLSGEMRLQWAPQDIDVLYEWSEKAQTAAEALEEQKELTVSQLRALVGEKDITRVINELLENEVVFINDALEPSYKPKREKIIKLAEAYQQESALSILFDELNRAPRQQELLMVYLQKARDKSFVRQQELTEQIKNASPLIKQMADKGIFIVQEQAVDRLVYDGNDNYKNITFTPAQQTAYNQLNEQLSEKEVVLLQGVTGSGKTLLYIHKIRECLAAGKQAIFLLPEIGLTTQLVRRLYAYFGEELGVYHSKFSNNERVEIWEKVQKGKYRIVVGPRSALWLPYNNLGLIIADEEHDGSYKQRDPAPRFHARDAAIYLAALHNKARVILGSATPSVESLYNARQGKYGFVELRERYMGVNMPSIEVVNAASVNAIRKQGFQILTPELIQAVTAALQNKKQIILFQNRRGYSPFQICTVCGWVPHCKNCAVSLTYHKVSDKLHCHYCGLKSNIIHTCSSCGSNRLISKSFGTEKIEEEVQQAFPNARIARMDLDSMRAKNSMETLLQKLELQKVDILVGTQMVVKGLDFANVSLVGILSADSLLSYPDFRVNERGFQLMEQVSGRAGRTDGAGRVLIQAHNTGHPVMRWVQEHDVKAYFENEIIERQMFSYPPFSRLIKISFKHRDEEKARLGAAQMAEALQSIEGIGIQGPAAAIVPRIRNLYIQEVWIKCPRDIRVLDRVKDFLWAQKDKITGMRGQTTTQVIFDIDPV